MAYKPLTKKSYAKPIASLLLQIEIDVDIIKCTIFIHGKDGEMLCWCNDDFLIHGYSYEDIKRCIVSFEHNVKRAIYDKCYEDYGFIIPNDYGLLFDM